MDTMGTTSEISCGYFYGGWIHIVRIRIMACFGDCLYIYKYITDKCRLTNSVIIYKVTLVKRSLVKNLVEASI
jgi:hypothetical protein